MSETDRRSLLKSAAAAAALGLVESASGEAAETGLQFAPPKPFSFDLLKEKVRKMAKEPHVGPPHPAPSIVGKIDYEAWGKIKFDINQSLYAKGPGRFPVSFFHLGMFFPKAVGMHVVENGQSREIIYDPSYFEMPADSPAQQLPKGAGFAGLRIQEARDNTTYDWHNNDWVAILGADYFRAIGELHQYGISCRAIALEVAVADRPEEFPDFTQIYIDESAPQNGLTLYALVEGPSIVGVCKMACVRGKGVVMDIDQLFCLRRDIVRFGVAPLTTMYWFSETVKPTAVDWRPEVHDSDGLSMWTGRGERLWRPLNNPQGIRASAFLDEDPHGFGLMQRDRNFDHYLDGVYYDRRPSLWVEPKGRWGKGSVQLVEINTDDEIHDNIVAMWVPEKPMTAGSEIEIGYKLYWLADEPHPTELARCVATRLGNGGQPGKPRPKGVRKFMVEFLGPPLASLPYGVKPEPVLWAARGKFSYIYTEAVPDDVPGHWRAQFDLTVTGAEPVEMRLFLRANGKILSEVWMFQYIPFVECQPSCYPKQG